MTDPTPEGGPRPTPRPRRGATGRHASRPRVPGGRHEREEVAATGAPPPTAPSQDDAAPTAAARPRAGSRRAPVPTSTAAAAPGRLPALVLVLALLCALAAAGTGWLVWQRSNPPYVDASIFAAARSGIEAVYAYDHEDSEGSVQGKLDVLTGELRDQYEEDLTQGGIIDAYEQVSATTRYEVLDVGLQQVDDAQDAATFVVFGQYVVESVNSGEQPAPEGSECRVAPGGARSCTQTVQVRLVQTDGEWKISELTVLTTS